MRSSKKNIANVFATVALVATVAALAGCGGPAAEGASDNSKMSATPPTGTVASPGGHAIKSENFSQALPPPPRAPQ